MNVSSAFCSYTGGSLPIDGSGVVGRLSWEVGRGEPIVFLRAIQDLFKTRHPDEDWESTVQLVAWWVGGI
jgi:hypothetical protein